MIEHALAMRNLPRAEPAGVGPVQAGRMRLEPQTVILAAPEQCPSQREANDHEDHITPRT